MARENLLKNNLAAPIQQEKEETAAVAERCRDCRDNEEEEPISIVAYPKCWIECEVAEPMSELTLVDCKRHCHFTCRNWPTNYESKYLSVCLCFLPVSHNSIIS